MKKQWGLATAAALSAAILTGCGGSNEDFCASFESLAAQNDDMTSAESLEQVESLAENAPSEIEDDVAVVEDASNQLREALDGTGVDLDVPGTDLSEEDVSRLSEAAAGIDIDQAQLTEANDNITQWAEENCSG